MPSNAGMQSYKRLCLTFKTKKSIYIRVHKLLNLIQANYFINSTLWVNFFSFVLIIIIISHFQRPWRDNQCGRVLLLFGSHSRAVRPQKVWKFLLWLKRSGKNNTWFQMSTYFIFYTDRGIFFCVTETTNLWYDQTYSLNIFNDFKNITNHNVLPKTCAYIVGFQSSLLEEICETKAFMIFPKSFVPFLQSKKVTWHIWYE